MTPTLPLLPPRHAGRAWVALSGGMDSVVLLHRLATSPDADISPVHAVHVHHGLHDDADGWQAQCEQLCASLGVPLHVVRVQVDRQSGHGLEAAARAARQQAFQGCMRDGDILVTAHHQDDQAETFLLRALRASGTEGLAAIRPWRAFGDGWQWRPLLETSRASLLAYAQAHALGWVDDPSNAQSAFDRNFLRNDILSRLRTRWPHAAAALSRSAALCGEAADLLDADDAHALAHARTADASTLRADVLASLPDARRARVLRLWIAQLDLPPLPAQGIARIASDLLPARADAMAQFAWSHTCIRRWRDLLHAAPARDPLPADWQSRWTVDQPVVLPDGGRLWIEADALPPLSLTLSARRGGERIRLPGRRHSHALKHVLQSEHVPPWDRDALPLLWSEDGALWAAGDLILSAACDDWLRRHGARLHWQRG